MAALLAIVLVVGLAWALAVAPWQSPDETAHFAYVQSLAESFTLPNVAGRYGRSSDEVVANAAVGAIRGAFYPDASPPSWSRPDERAYLAAERSAHPPSRSDGSGFTNATGNPPLYYLVATIPYLIDHGGTAFGRLYSIRIAGVLLLGLTALGAWLLAGEIFGRNRQPQLACAAVAALVPMCSFISTAVTPDALLITTWTFALWLGARVINHRGAGIDAAALCAVTAAAILTKATSYALVGPVALALLAGWLRRPQTQRRTAALRLSGAGLVLAVPVLAWVALAPGFGGVSITTVGAATHPFSPTEFLRYLWQFYLPRLPFMTPFPSGTGLPAYEIWVRQLTGDFSWLSIPEPAWIYAVAKWAAPALVVVVIALLARLRGRWTLSLLGFLVLTLVALLGLLHVTGYRTYLAGGGEFLQGRYLLPAISLLGLAVALVVAWVPARVRPLACALTLSALLAWQAISLSAVVGAFYL